MRLFSIGIAVLLMSSGAYAQEAEDVLPENCTGCERALMQQLRTHDRQMTSEFSATRQDVANLQATVDRIEDSVGDSAPPAQPSRRAPFLVDSLDSGLMPIWNTHRTSSVRDPDVAATLACRQFGYQRGLALMIETGQILRGSEIVPALDLTTGEKTRDFRNEYGRVQEFICMD